MSWQKEFNKLFTDSFFRFLFGFTIIIALSFGIMILTTTIADNTESQDTDQPAQEY